MSFYLTVKKTCSASLVVSLFLAVLAAASVLPDICVENGDCCSHESSPGICGTLCCAGILAAPEAPVILERPSAGTLPLTENPWQPDLVASEPLIRPPIPA